MKPVCTSILLIGIAAGHCMLMAQTEANRPIQAKFRHAVYRIDESGAQVLTQEERGTFLRASNGSVRSSLHPVVNGVEQPQAARELLTDGVTGNVYNLLPSRREAQLMRRVRTPITPVAPEPRSFSGEEIVNGVLCKKRPVKCLDSVLGTEEDCGSGWYSPEYQLHIRIETYQVLKDGARSLDVHEMTDIEVREPAPDVFRLPGDFRVTPSR
ncbi:MAG: hypothetical protein JNL98_28060 [Bryobacterales bacterium]|nr:hypothetical protein [Bryobacterales bacterium]